MGEVFMLKDLNLVYVDIAPFVSLPMASHEDTGGGRNLHDDKDKGEGPSNEDRCPFTS